MKFIFPNFRLIFFEIVFGFLTEISIFTIREPMKSGDVAIGICLTVIGVLGMLGFLVFLPHFFVFDKKGVRIYYVLGFKESAKWTDIDSVETFTHYYSSYRGGWWHTVYMISPMESRDLFFMESEVNKTWYIRLIIEHYWDGTIDDDGLFARIRRSRSEPRNTLRAENEERKIKSAVHDVLKPYRGRFEVAGVNISVSFNFDGKEKRPLNDNYHYNALFKLKRMDDGTEDEIEFPLLRVVRGHKEYRPIPIKNALSQIEEIFNEELSEIYDENDTAASSPNEM